MTEPTGQSEGSTGIAAPKGKSRLLETIAVVLLLLNTLGAWGNARPQGDTAYAIGAVLAPAILVLLVVGVFRAFGKAKSRRSRAIIACWTLVLMFFGQGATFARNQELITITDADRAGLSIQGGVIKHTSLGFELPYPEGFARDSTVEAAAEKVFSGYPGATAWGFRAMDSSAVMFVLLVKGRGQSSESLAAFARGIRESVHASAGDILLDSLEPAGPSAQYQLAARSKQSAYWKVRCIPSLRDEGAWLIACVLTVTPDSTGLDFVRSGLRFVN